jgi:probable F420-dependent oxidoreductase
MSTRYGITIPFDGVTLADHREWFTKIADLGYTDLWSSEVDGADGFTPLALAAAWESRLNLGIAVTPVFTRGPGLLAMSIAALAEAAPGRFTMGIGASSLPVVQKWNGISYEQPFARTRDVTQFLQRALAGEKIDEEFETFAIHGFRLSRPVAVKPPILVGALRPGMLRLAGDVGDGAILNWLGADDVSRCTAEVGDGATIAARLFVIPTTDSETARWIARRMISSYLTVPTYAEFHRWLGRGELLQPMWDAWAAGDRKLANELIPDAVIDELIIHGPFEKCREHVARYVAAGVQIPALAVIPVNQSLDDVLTGLAPH